MLILPPHFFVKFKSLQTPTRKVLKISIVKETCGNDLTAPV